MSRTKRELKQYSVNNDVDDKITVALKTMSVIVICVKYFIPVFVITKFVSLNTFFSEIKNDDKSES